MSNNLKKLWIIGAGQMAIEYAKVLNELNIDYDIIGRGRASAVKFEKKFNKNVYTGGINNYLKKFSNKKPCGCIVAVGLEELSSVTILLIKYGIKNILVEKPGGVYSNQIKQIYNKALNYNANVYISYNRRFYGSTLKALELINKNDGVLSFHFEFTEWIHQIEKLDISPIIKQNWFFVNSTHVIDLAFFLGGSPKNISCYLGSGGGEWNPKTYIFSGSGISKKGALFSYNANWCSAGRWSVEVLTKSNRLILSPLEQLQIIYKASTVSEYVKFDNDLDTRFKPGLYLQTQAFINNENSNLCTISEQVNNIKYYKQISSDC
ncbi:myo-inositol 2-dehydrogenase [Candidatus Magnetomorum sp. HK-1]|nr:myo-inositol 2-dehydrogenase [Candidatus Magnetomorum sp. HK-1]